MQYIIGDICDTNADFILQQCNCLTVSAHGLSDTIASRFPYANPYSQRRQEGKRNLAIEPDRDVPGTVKIFYDISNINNPSVVCLFGQWRPGKINTLYFSSYPESSPPETKEQREIWFQIGLTKLIAHIRQSQYSRRVMIAVPYGIGCGLAGGRWDTYLSYLETCQRDNGDILAMYIYKLE